MYKQLFSLLLCVFITLSSAQVNFTVVSVLPPQSPTSGNQDVVVSGTNFFHSDDIACSFVLNKVSYTVEGSFISSNKIQCTTPRVNKSGDYYLEISEDGISYTYNQVIFSFYDDAHNDKAGVITGIVVLVALFSLTTTGVGVYFWRKRKEREHVDNAEASFSLLPGMKGVHQFQRHSDL